MRRQRAHLRVAEAMERVYGSRADRHASDVAQHLYQAGVAADPDKTIRCLTLAGDQSLEAGAFDEALRQFADPLSIQEEQENQRAVADLHYKKGLALRSLGRFEESVEALQRAFDVFVQLDDAEDIARTAYDLADQTSWVKTREARIVARRALDLVGDRDAAARARMLGLLARFSGLAGDPYRPAHDALTEADTLAARLDRPELTTELLAARSRFHWSYMQFPEAIDVGRRAMAMLKERGELYEVAEVSWQVHACAVFVARWDFADEVKREMDVVTARAGNNFGWWCCEAIGAKQLLSQTADLDNVIDVANQNLEWAAQNAPLWRGYDLANRAGARFYAGNWEDARADYDESLRLEPGGFLDGHHRTIALVARVYAGDDVLDRWLEEHSLALTLEEENPVGLWEVAVNVVEGLAVLNRRDEAAALHATVMRGIDKGRALSFHCRLWQMVAGIAAACGEQWDAAQEHYETALKQAHDLPHKIAQPEIRRWYAQILLDRNAPGDLDRARTPLGEAIAMYQTIGMPKHVEMAEGLRANRL